MHWYATLNLLQQACRGQTVRDLKFQLTIQRWLVVERGKVVWLIDTFKVKIVVLCNSFNIFMLLYLLL